MKKMTFLLMLLVLLLGLCSFAEAALPSRVYRRNPDSNAKKVPYNHNTKQVKVWVDENGKTHKDYIWVDRHGRVVRTQHVY